MSISRRMTLLAPAFLAASFATVLPAQAATTLNKGYAPSQNFDLSHWKLTIPSGVDVATSVLNSGYQYANVFYTDPATGGMVFKCPNIAGTTSGSHYSRTELREMLAPDQDTSSLANNWRTSDWGTLRTRLRVDHVSTTGDADKVGRVVIGQIHGPDSEVIRLYYSKKPGEALGRIYAGMDSVTNSNTYSPDIVPNTGGAGIPLGQPFAYTIRLTDLRLAVYIRTASGQLYSYIKYIDPGYKGLNLYYKAGVYNQNNTGDTADYTQATVFSLTHTHP